MRPPPLHDVLAGLLREAGEVALDRFLTVEAERKRDHTEVTEADRLSEAMLVRGLGIHFPGEGVVGEEGARVAGERTWYVDPIDGTACYLEGLAYWGPVLGRVVDGCPEAGGVLFPRLSELWFAQAGAGAWRSGRRLPSLEALRLGRDSVVLVPSRFHTVATLGVDCKVRNLGSIAAHLCQVAAGGAVATLVGPGWRPWDVVAGLVLLEEVGGVALSLDGSPLDVLSDPSAPFVAGGRAACDDLLSTLRPHRHKRA